MGYVGSTDASLKYSRDANGNSVGANALLAWASFLVNTARDRWSFSPASAAFTDMDLPAVGVGSPINKAIMFQASNDSTPARAGTAVTLRIAFMVIDAI